MDSQLLQSLVNALPIPAMILKDDFVIACGNREAERLFERNLKGMGFARVLRHPEALKCLSAAAESGERNITEFVISSPTPRTYEVSAAPIGDDGYLCFTLLDISAELDAEKSRSTFVANVSHELRSPLTSLSGIVETLKGPARNDPKAQERFLDLMQGETERMARLVGDLLSLSKLEAKEHVAPEDIVNLVAVIQKVIDVLAATTPDHIGRVVLNTFTQKIDVVGDQDELTEVFQNLLENALKYSAPETEVEIDMSKQDDLDGRILVTITDHGDGIAPEHIPRLTERFYRVDKGRSREMGGTGLGLAITKHILKRHRAKWSFKSELGVGTQVEIEFRSPE